MDKTGLRGFGAHCCCCITGHWTWDWPPEKKEFLGQLSSYTYVCIPHRQIIDETYYASSSILNDSSLAAIISTNKDRHLFFQGPQSVIRRMIYSANLSQWIVDPDPIPISNAKNLTPLAVSRYLEDGVEEVTLSLKIRKHLD